MSMISFDLSIRFPPDKIYDFAAWKKWVEKISEVNMLLKQHIDVGGDYYPGKYFNHVLECYPSAFIKRCQASNIATKVQSITCLCGQETNFREVIKADGDVDLFTCSNCYLWHTVLWRARKSKSWTPNAC